MPRAKKNGVRSYMPPAPGGGNFQGGPPGGGGAATGAGAGSGQNFSAGAAQQRQGALGTTKAQVAAGVAGQRINSPVSNPFSRAAAAASGQRVAISEDAKQLPRAGGKPLSFNPASKGIIGPGGIRRGSDDNNTWSRNQESSLGGGGWGKRHG